MEELLQQNKGENMNQIGPVTTLIMMMMMMMATNNININININNKKFSYRIVTERQLCISL